MYTIDNAINRFSRGNGAASLRSNEPITLDRMRQVAPSVFAEGKHDSRSDRYAYIPTSEILSKLMNEGFQPFSVAQGGSRDDEKRGFTKHMIRLRHESTGSMLAQTIQRGVHQFVNDGPVFPEIVLLNSHDGTSAYRLMAGMFRLACLNGLIVASSTLEDIRIPHKGDVAGRVLEGCFEIMDRLPTVSESMKEMQALRLTDGERQAFATAALVAKYDSAEEAPIKAADLLGVKRGADAEPTIWNTFNTVQEHLVRGGDRYVQRNDNGRIVARRQTREVKGIDQNTGINRALWALAEEMKKLKTA